MFTLSISAALRPYPQSQRIRLQARLAANSATRSMVSLVLLIRACTQQYAHKCDDDNVPRSFLARLRLISVHLAQDPGREWLQVLGLVGPSMGKDLNVRNARVRDGTHKRNDRAGATIDFIETKHVDLKVHEGHYAFRSPGVPEIEPRKVHDMCGVIVPSRRRRSTGWGRC